MEAFTIGGVLRESARITGRHFGLLLASSFILVGLTRLLASAAVRSALLAGSPAWTFLPGTLSAFGTILLQAVIVRIVVDDANDRKPTLRDGLGASFRAFFPLLGVGLLFTIGLSLAAILFLFPAAMVFCRWAVVTSVTVAERPGVFAAFRRSAELTKGVRWRVFGLALLVWLLAAILAGLNAGVAGAVGHEAGIPAQLSWTVVLVSAVVGPIASILTNVIFAATYVGLRRAKEGVLSQDLVAAFD